MANEAQAENLGEPLANADMPQPPNPPFARPDRHDTGSTVSSGSQTPKPIPPGFYTLPIHGNCPRCHHHHRAATINIRVSGEYNRVSHVYCERCQEKWLAFGGGNSTRVSLLSTQTTEPDLVEKDFRYALIDMVRSVTSIASPKALASVPEQPSGGPSREQSLRSRGKQSSDAGEAVTHGSSPARDASLENRTDPNTPRPGNLSAKQGSVNHPVGKAKNAFLKLQSKVKDRLPKLPKLRLRLRVRTSKEPKFSDKALGKQPAAQTNTLEEPAAPSKSTEAPPVEDSRDPDLKAAGRHHYLMQRPKSQDVPVPELKLQNGIDKEKLRNMTREQRIAWIRELFTDYKCRCAGHCYCRRAPSFSIPDHTADTGLGQTPSAPHVPHRRHSHDLLLIGSHLTAFRTDDFSYPSRFSIGSTRLSQAATAVNSDGLTVTSGGPGPMVDAAQRQGGRSRPNSLPVPGPSQLRHSMSAEDFEGAPSIRSFSTGGAVHNMSVNGHRTHRHSSSSSSSASARTNPDPGPSRASTPYGNGHRTSGERFRFTSRTA